MARSPTGCVSRLARKRRLPVRKLLFVDRDGTLIEEPDDRQVDRLDKVRLKPGVFAGLGRLAAAGYELVMVTNQDGLGTDGYPQAAFDTVQTFVLDAFASQGIRFADVRVCPHLPANGCACRKPRTGMLHDYLADDGWSRSVSAVVGDRAADVELAANLGVRGFRLTGIDGPGDEWPGVAASLLDAPRRARVERNTRETRISVEVDLDAAEPVALATGIGFLDHMLEQLARHGGFALTLECAGDLDVDEHHSLEDCALALGEALRRALGDKRGIGRYGFLLPMDETQARAALDLSGRPHLSFDAAFARESVGGLATELVPHFFLSFANALGATLHLEVRGDNDHHKVEALFKATGRTLRQALARAGDAVPSTKGAL
ncbi:MAG: bifunctional histidinol-phosphatase/imidazoleglycerol-phosphate dehydratase HisB [Gammaproteobacteria bacterium]